MKSLSLYGYFKIQLLADLRTRRQDYVCLFLFAILLHILTAGIWHPMPDTGLYINQARNLIQGQGLTHANMTRWIASPGYPVLISPFFLFSDLPLVALTYFQAATTALYMLGVYVWASRHTRKSAILITGAATLHAAVLEYCLPITTEAAFMATMIWAIVFFSLWCDNRKTRLGTQAFIIAILLMSYCTLIRPAGLMVALGAAFMVLQSDLANGRRFKHSFLPLLIWLGIPSLILISFLAHEAVCADGNLIQGTYLSGLIPAASRNLFELMLSGLHKRIADMGRLMIPGLFKAYSRQESWQHVTMFFYIPLAMLMCYVWYKMIRKLKPDAMLLGIVPFTVLHIIYAKFSDGARFMTPMLPVIICMTWYFLNLIKLPKHALMLVIFVLHASITIGVAIYHQPRLIDIQKQWKAAQSCNRLISNTPGQIVCLNRLNYLDLQICLLSDRQLKHNPSIAELKKNQPVWVLRRVPGATINNYRIAWTDKQFQLLKSISTPVSDHGR